MSAVPKRKLCWNCEGHVLKDNHNCPYCGVYLQGSEEEDLPLWRPVYTTSEDEEEGWQDHKTVSLPSPDFSTPSFVEHLRQGLLPLLLLMGGSVFFLFGVILLLFSENGTLVLQWNGDNWLYFLLASLPAFILGWKFFQDLPSD